MQCRGNSRGLAAIEVVFSLPVILLCVGIAVYVGAMMKTRLSLLGAVQDVARVCSMGQPAANAITCAGAMDVADRVERCDNLQLSAVIETFDRDYTGVVNGSGQTGQLVDRGTVELQLLHVTGQCDVQVQFPLQFAEFSVLQFSLSEQAASPLRVERDTLP